MTTTFVQSVARCASPPALIRRWQEMPVNTMRLTRVLSDDSNASQEILAMSYGLEVVGPNTGGISAKVIQVNRAFYRTDCNLPEPAMRKFGFVAYAKTAIAVFVLRAGPKPASRTPGVHSGKETHKRLDQLWAA